MIRRTRYTLLAAVLVGVCSTVPAAAQEPGITIETALGRGVVDRVAVDTASAFPADVGAVFLWMRVEGAAGTTLQHVWTHGPHEAVVDLPIGGSPWRTWSSRTVPPDWTGEWRVEIRDEGGNVLETVMFTVG
jgi:hypothetical protein